MVVLLVVILLRKSGDICPSTGRLNQLNLYSSFFFFFFPVLVSVGFALFNGTWSGYINSIAVAAQDAQSPTAWLPHPNRVPSSRELID